MSTIEYRFDADGDCRSGVEAEPTTGIRYLTK